MAGTVAYAAKDSIDLKQVSELIKIMYKKESRLSLHDLNGDQKDIMK